MAKSSLYAAHRAAGAASGRYKASLYDIANVGYAMEADIGIEAIKGEEKQKGWATLEAALGVADTAYGAYQDKKQHEERFPDTKKPKKPKEDKKPSVKEKKEVLKLLGSKKNPFQLSGTGVKAVGDLFRQAKEAGVEEGSKIWGKIGDEVKQWEYIYK